MVDVKLNHKQAQELARAIFADIDAYVQTHQEEFREFLAEEEANEEVEHSKIA